MSSFADQIRQAYRQFHEATAQVEGKRSVEGSTLKHELYREYGSVLKVVWPNVLESLPKTWESQCFNDGNSFPTFAGRFHVQTSEAQSWIVANLGESCRPVFAQAPQEMLERIELLASQGAAEIKDVTGMERLVEGLENAARQSISAFCDPLTTLLMNNQKLPIELQNEKDLLNLLAPLEIIPSLEALLHFAHLAHLVERKDPANPLVTIKKENGNWDLCVENESFREMIASLPPVLTARVVCPAHQVEGAFRDITRWSFNTLVVPCITDLCEVHRRVFT